MENNTTQLIKERYSKLPQELKDAVTAADLPLKMKTISTTHGLLIDQLEGLQNEILFVLLGIEGSSSFVDNLCKEIEIPREKALAIAQDTNKLIFDPIREHLKEWEEKMELEEQKENEEKIKEEKLAAQKNTAVASLEKVGGFSIEKNEGSVTNENTTLAKEVVNDVKPSDKDAILMGIENPVPVKSVITSKINVLEKPEVHVDPLIDHLLTTPVAMPEQRIEKVAVEVPKKIPVPVKPSGPDKYREPIE